MSNIRLLWKNRWDDATISATSESSGFPVSNTQHRWHTRVWRSEAGLSGSSVDIEGDLGDNFDVQALVIKNHNFDMLSSGDELRLQAKANAGDAWGAVDRIIAVTSGLIIFFFNRVKNYRYWRIRMIDSLNSDGYLEKGRIYLGPYFEPHYDIRHKRPVFKDLSSVKRSTGGQISSDQKSRFRAWSYMFNSTHPDDFDTFWEIWQEIGKSKDYFICRDADAASPYAVTYYVQNLDDWDFDPREKDFYKFTIQVEELL